MIKRNDFIWHPDDAHQLIGQQVWMFNTLDGEDAEKRVLEGIGSHSSLPFRSGAHFSRFIAEVKEHQDSSPKGIEIQRKGKITVPILESIQNDLKGVKLLSLKHERYGLGVEVKLPEEIEEYFTEVLKNLVKEGFRNRCSCTISFHRHMGLSVVIEGGQLSSSLSIHSEGPC